MRIKPERLQALKTLLKEQCGLDYTDEQAQEAGMAIIRFVLVKERRAEQLRSNDKDDQNGRAENRKAHTRR